MSMLNTPVFERNAMPAGDAGSIAGARVPNPSGLSARPSVTDEPPRVVRGVFFGLVLAGAGWALIAEGMSYAFR